MFPSFKTSLFVDNFISFRVAIRLVGMPGIAEIMANSPKSLSISSSSEATTAAIVQAGTQQSALVPSAAASAAVVPAVPASFWSGTDGFQSTKSAVTACGTKLVGDLQTTVGAGGLS